MERPDLESGIADLIREAGETHHRVYRLTDGDDPEWPLWYAEWLLEQSELPDLLGAKPTRSEMVHLLVTLDKELAAGPVEGDWQTYYARRLIEQFADG